MEKLFTSRFSWTFKVDPDSIVKKSQTKTAESHFQKFLVKSDVSVGHWDSVSIDKYMLNL
jgi:hypothetical protein